VTSRARRTIRLAGCIAACVALAAGTAAQEAQPANDSSIQKEIQRQLAEDSIRGIQIAVQGGNVSLTGSVRSLWAKRRAVEVARKTEGVKTVTSELTVRQAESDTSLVERIAGEIRRYVFYSIFDDVSLKAERGVVTLMGRVTTPIKASQMEELASRVPGVQDVKNEIKVLPVSPVDDQLRQALASRIYNDPVFWNYAISTDPPIHIIVENSRVTLTGVVGSPLEKQKAEIIARSTFGVLSVENALRVER
jgi:osmotically-inducible protein OsmY